MGVRPELDPKTKRNEQCRPVAVHHWHLSSVPSDALTTAAAAAAATGVVAPPSAVKMAKWWQKMHGCPGEPQSEYNDDRLECYVYCSSAPANARLPMSPMKHSRPEARYRREKAKQMHSGRPILKMCGMKGVGHDLNTPYHGYPFDVAW